MDAITPRSLPHLSVATETEEATALLEDVNCEVAVLVSTISRSAEGRFESETIYQIEFSPHNHSCSRFSSLLNDEIATVETKILRILTK